MVIAQDTYSPALEHEDAAWVRIATSLSTNDLHAFLDDVERLYRINPHLEISAFEPSAQSRFRLVAYNHSNDRNVDVVLAVTTMDTGLEITYSDGLKRATNFRVEAALGGSHLFVTDVYGGSSVEERHLRAGEVDLSLNAWGRGLHDYLKRWARWHRFAPWRWYMRHVWQPMKPSARRVVWMIWMISLFEMVAASVLLAVWLAVRRSSA
jgi:hypothetical protein